MSGDSAKLEQALRDEVRRIWDSGNHEGLTVKRVRKAVEEELDLPQDFFKNDDVWKDHSKDVITDQVEQQEQQPAAQDEAASSADEIKSPPKPPGGRKKSAEQPAKAAKAPRKRAPAQPKPTARKKRKVSVVSDESADEAVSDHNSPEPTMAEAAGPDPDSDTEEKNTSANVKKQSPDENNDEDDDDADGPNLTAKPSNEPTENAADSESELSSLLDEPPPPKAKRQKKSAAGDKKPIKPRATKAKQEKEVDPQDAEIKRLQGWLVKCGIRKVWGKELKPYTTPREKISHLKGMLKDAGMDGRYSVEKARQIKERRELAADLEAVQEGNKKWGQSDSEEEDSKVRPRRRLARGLKDLEGLIDEDGEESD